MKYNGLVILKAYLGEPRKLSSIQKKINNLKFTTKDKSLHDSVNEFEEQVTAIGVQTG